MDSSWFSADPNLDITGLRYMIHHLYIPIDKIIPYHTFLPTQPTIHPSPSPSLLLTGTTLSPTLTILRPPPSHSLPSPPLSAQCTPKNTFCPIPSPWILLVLANVTNGSSDRSAVVWSIHTIWHLRQGPRISRSVDVWDDTGASAEAELRVDKGLERIRREVQLSSS